MKKLLFVICYLLIMPTAFAVEYGVQNAWDNPDANMAAGSVKPGYAQLSWTPGAVMSVKLRNGMVTMINLPAGEEVADAVVGNGGLFDIQPQKTNILITPAAENQGSDTNLIVTGKSGNIYSFYLRSEPANSAEITYSQVDVSADGAGANRPNAASISGSGMQSVMSGGKSVRTVSTVGVDGEDYGWIKSMKIDPSEFRFDLDIFVPNPDDYIIAPERVWRDRIFTYIDFGDKAIAMTQRPVVSILVEGGESPVGFRTDGENGRLIIVEAVGDMVLRSGQRIVCIKKREKPFLIADTASVMAMAESNLMNSAYATQSFNNVNYMGGAQMTSTNGYGVAPTYQAPVTQGGGGGAAGMNMLSGERTTAGAYLPSSNIPLITSNQSGVSVELRSDTSVAALDSYWVRLLAKFSGDDGKGLLTPYKDKVFYAVDDQGVGDLGASSNGATARLYRLRLGPIADIDTATNLCDKLNRSEGMACHVVRVQ